MLSIRVSGRGSFPGVRLAPPCVRPETIRFGEAASAPKTFHAVSVSPVYQGGSNGCGTASAAMVLNSLCQNLVKKPAGFPFTMKALDAAYRKLDSFIAPHELVRLTREAGLYAAMKNQLGFEAIQKHLDQGHLLIPVYRPSPNHSELHYSVIHGYNSAKKEILLTDPALKTSPTRWVSYDVFSEKSGWANVALGSFPTGLNRFAVVLSAKNDIDAASQDLPVLRLKLAHWANQLMNLIG